jgi:prepilin-type N-terminal cleavage/methylation domain-containing protein
LNTKRGFTLIEVLIAAGVLACGLAAVAALFSFVIRTNVSNRQMAIATSLLYDKMEEYRAAAFNDPIWTTMSGTETVVVKGTPFIRTWQIDSSVPRSVTVTVYAAYNALTQRQTELIRATTLVSPNF